MEWAIVNTSAALDALGLINDVKLLDLADDSINRAVSGALGAALASIGNDELEELLAGTSGALLVVDVCEVLVTEVTEC